jgi:hypothetical protein
LARSRCEPASAINFCLSISKIIHKLPKQDTRGNYLQNNC